MPAIRSSVHGSVSRWARRALRAVITALAFWVAAGSPSAHAEPAKMDDGAAIGPERARDENWLDAPRKNGDRNTGVLALGIVVLGALLWFSRRQRERLEREDQRAERAERRKADPDSDADADDLHAAARGTRTDADRHSPP